MFGLFLQTAPATCCICYRKNCLGTNRIAQDSANSSDSHGKQETFCDLPTHHVQ